jgi:hypothetical protein
MKHNLMTINVVAKKVTISQLQFNSYKECDRRKSFSQLTENRKDPFINCSLSRFFTALSFSESQAGNYDPLEDAGNTRPSRDSQTGNN